MVDQEKTPLLSLENKEISTARGQNDKEVETSTLEAEPNNSTDLKSKQTMARKLVQDAYNM